MKTGFTLSNGKPFSTDRASLVRRADSDCSPTFARCVARSSSVVDGCMGTPRPHTVATAFQGHKGVNIDAPDSPSVEDTVASLTPRASTFQLSVTTCAEAHACIFKSNVLRRHRLCLKGR